MIWLGGISFHSWKALLVGADFLWHKKCKLDQLIDYLGQINPDN